MSRTFTNCGYSVTVNDDRSILVKPGDWISKYAAAIYGDPNINWKSFKKKEGNVFVDLPDPHRIEVGKLIYHPGPLPGEPMYPGQPVSGQPVAPGAPRSDGMLVPERLIQFLRYLKQWISPANDWTFKNSSGLDLSAAVFAAQYMAIQAFHRGEPEPYTFHAIGLGLGVGPEDIAASLALSPPDMWGAGYIGKCITAGRTLSADEICGNYIVLDFSAGLFVGGSFSILMFGINLPLQAVVRTISRYLRGEQENILILPSAFYGAAIMLGSNISTPNLGVSFKVGMMHRWECVTG
jgi:hypothetical protein